MERTDKLTKGIGLVLFLALLAYLGYYIYNSVADPVRTALAVEINVSISSPVTGLIVREESILTSTEPNLYISAEDGQMLAAGAVAARAYDDESALERADRIRSIMAEITRVQEALSGGETETDAIQTDSIRRAVTALSGAVSRGELSNLDVSCVNLRSLVFGAQAETATEEQLAALQQEMAGLMHGASFDTRDITVPASGLFTHMVDGWEELTPEDVMSISTDTLREMEETTPSVPQIAYGKLVNSFTWYYAAILERDALHGVKTGTRVRLDFGRSYNRPIDAKVCSIGPEDGRGSCVVVFSCTTGTAEMLSLRKAAAEVIFEEYSGIRVPTEALHTDEDGTSYVYVMTGLLAERKDVEILHQEGEITVVARQIGTDALREGNEIIVSARDLYDGKVMD